MHKPQLEKLDNCPLDLGTECRVLCGHYPLWYILAKRIVGKIRFGGFTLGTVMVSYAGKKTEEAKR